MGQEIIWVYCSCIKVQIYESVSGLNPVSEEMSTLAFSGCVRKERVVSCPEKTTKEKGG